MLPRILPFCRLPNSMRAIVASVPEGLGWLSHRQKNCCPLKHLPVPARDRGVHQRQRSAAALPPARLLRSREVYHADESARFVGVRDCKGDANSTDPKTITCTVGGTVGVGGGQSLALFNFPGNWSGAQTKTFNPKSSTGPFDIGDPHRSLQTLLLLIRGSRDGERQRWNPNTRHQL